MGFWAEDLSHEGVGGNGALNVIHWGEDIGEGRKVAYALPQRAGEWKRVSVWPGMCMGEGGGQVECFL